MGRWNDYRRVTPIFQPIDQPQRRFFQHREGQFVIVIFVAFVPACDARGPTGVSFRHNDNPSGVMVGNIGRFLRKTRRRIILQRLAIGDTNQVDT